MRFSFAPLNLFASSVTTPETTKLAPANIVAFQNAAGGTSSAIIGIAPDNSIWWKPTFTFNGWLPSSGGPRARDLVQLFDQSFVIIGTDNTLYTCPGISVWAPCNQVQNSGKVKSIDQFTDGTFLGVGMDNNLYTRSNINAPWTWIQNSGSVIDVTILSSGAILGTAPDGNLYIRSTLYQNWYPISGGCCVISTTQLIDGSIVGVGPDQALYKKQTLNDNWRKTTLFGESQRKTFHQRWIQLPGGLRVLDFVMLYLTTFLVIGTDYKLYDCKTILSGDGCVPVANPGLVKSIQHLTPTASSSEMKFAGVGLDNQVYTRTGVEGTWSLVQNAGTVVDVTKYGDLLYGTAPDGTMYTKKDLNDPWVYVPNSCCVISTGVAPDGSLFGVGTDNAVYKWQDQGWSYVQNSQAVVKVTGAWV
ncbi:hypothetical protein BCR33DRAFT_735808 [Rhizoclosmatium globosum]|uniref:Uncharacterized protein n=1 Tax=Rhizoclosmatium globosum TaxID=329046 RepID=A0A1Y2CKR1_9FUNG|nr:hypothetical protein BCR33DRAFT_735808 [Rhizoclosmatium globosum]|eukprot:ORY47602.1 hypothetical protein BCR33DRAFT_735808 [Rhizoclosmatium globosum]